MIPGAVHRSPGNCLTAEENHGKPLMKAVQPFIASNGVPYLQMRSVGPHSTPVWAKEGKKEGIGLG